MKSSVAYLRTSSAANVDGDSGPRQQAAINAYARANQLRVVETFYDKAVSGADPISERPGFRDLLSYMQGDGARVILVENASRFARDLGVQLTGHALLKSLGFDLIPVDCPTHFTDETPTANLVRQILGAVSEFEKANLVAKLRAARDRLSVKVGRRIEGRDHTSDAARTRARELHGQKKTLRDIAAVLETEGHVGATGKRFTPSTVSRMVRS